jgi:NAD(P)-dependent dehydrogenase (short-subunit alcohol dehydrogenase family)
VALEAIAETIAIEAGHFGISVQLLEPGAVASGGAERAKVFLDDGNPYRPLLDQMQGFRSDPVTVEEVAGAVAVADAHPPLRTPVGASAASVLAARKAAAEDVPFLAAPLDW